MKINKRFIWSETIDDFISRLDNNEVDNESIAFIENPRQIWTQGQYFPCPYTKEELDNIISNLDNEYLDKDGIGWLILT